MKVHTDINAIEGIKRPILTIGTFDGVHRGHRVIIDRLNEIADEVDGESVLLTFHPHPRSVVSEAGSISLLSSLEERLALLEAAGLQHVVVYPFTQAFSRISALQYVRDLLVNSIGVYYAVVGYDHHFGRNREGDIKLLKELAELYEFKVEEIDAQTISEVKVSSTKIRLALSEGDVATANEYMGYEYSLSGTVVTGDGRGRSLGFPTANVLPNNQDKLVPAVGVYAVQVVLDSGVYKGMLNIGTRPTFKEADGQLTLEVHILDFNQDIYAEKIRLIFKQRIRAEQTFTSAKELEAQLGIDRQRIIKILD